MTLTDTQIRAHAHALLYRRRCRQGAVKAPATDLVAYAAKAWMNARGLPTGSRAEWVEAWLAAWASERKRGRPRVHASEEHITVRVSRHIRDAYLARARERGVSLTRVVVEALEVAIWSTAHTSTPSSQSPAPSSSRSPTDP